MKYALALLSFKAPGFTPAPGQSGDGPLLLEPVTITSLNAPGVVPRSSQVVPPGYAHKSQGDYNTTIGFLENGNQRCVLVTPSRSPAAVPAYPDAMRGWAVYICRDGSRSPHAQASRTG